MNFGKQQIVAGVITIMAGVFALACMITGLVALDYNFDAFSDPLLILTMQGVNVDAARWSMVLDMFGYYLFLLPVIFLFHRWIKDRTYWSHLISFCGSSYVLVGAIGAAALTAVWPSVMASYSIADHDSQLILKSNFLAFNQMVYDGLWNLLEMFFAGFWWILTGIILYKNNISFIGIFTTVLGICCLLDGIAGVFQIPFLHQFALNAYLFLAIVWAILVGAFLLKQPLK